MPFSLTSQWFINKSVWNAAKAAGPCQNQKKKKRKEIEHETEKKLCELNTKKKKKMSSLEMNKERAGGETKKGVNKGLKGRRFYNSRSHSKCKVYPVNYDIH